MISEYPWFPIWLALFQVNYSYNAGFGIYLSKFFFKIFLAYLNVFAFSCSLKRWNSAESVVHAKEILEKTLRIWQGLDWSRVLNDLADKSGSPYPVPGTFPPYGYQLTVQAFCGQFPKVRAGIDQLRVKISRIACLQGNPSDVVMIWMARPSALGLDDGWARCKLCRLR